MLDYWMACLLENYPQQLLVRADQWAIKVLCKAHTLKVRLPFLRKTTGWHCFTFALVFSSWHLHIPLGAIQLFKFLFGWLQSRLAGLWEVKTMVVPVYRRHSYTREAVAHRHEPSLSLPVDRVCSLSVVLWRNLRSQCEDIRNKACERWALTVALASLQNRV